MELRIKTPNGTTAINLGQSPVTANGQQPTSPPGVSAMQILAGWGHGSTSGLGGADWTSGCGVYRGEAYRMGPSYNQEMKEREACEAAGIGRLCSPNMPFGVWQFPMDVAIPAGERRDISWTLPIAGRMFAYEVCITPQDSEATKPIVESMYLDNLLSATGATYRMVWPADAPAATLTAISAVSNMAVAGADLVLNVAINGTAVTGGAVTVPVGAAGSSGSSTPTGDNTIAPGQTLLITVAGGNTTASSNGSINLAFLPLASSVGDCCSGGGCEECGGYCSLVKVGDWKSRQITNAYPGPGTNTGIRNPTTGVLTPYDPSRVLVSSCRFSSRRLLNGQNFLPPWVPNVELENGNDELQWSLYNNGSVDVIAETIIHIKYGKFDLAKAAQSYCEAKQACEC